MILSQNIEHYIESLCELESTELQQLNVFTQENIHGSHMISGRYQGRLLSMISKLIRPKNILEIGTFTGYSALCLAEGLQTDGQLISLELNENLKPLHEQYLAKNPQIKVIYGKALESLQKIDAMFDLVFIDADKGSYLDYYEEVMKKLNSGGVILTDNILWRGKVAESTIDDTDRHAKIIKTLQEFNQYLHQDSRVEHLILPIRDGISIARKK
mgnify:CR=1 FL=1